MQVQWTDFAWKMLSQTADDIFAEFGYHAYCRFLDDIDASVNQLAHFPLLGKEEPLLVGRVYLYRSIVVEKWNKIIYTIDDEHDTIFIADFWDVRREPQILVDSL